jgi:probable HAF family extracellular repeat protein
MKFRMLLTFGVLTAIAASQLDGQDLPKANKHHHYKLVDLGTLGGPNSQVNGLEAIRDISRRGTVTGAADTTTTDPFCFVDCFVNHAFAWRNGKLTDLGALPGDGNNSYGIWIAGSGLVVGVSENGMIDPDTGTPEYHAVRWNNGSIRDLGTLGGTLSLASSANDRGEVVGAALNTVSDPWLQGPSSFLSSFFFFPGTTQAHAFLWERGSIQDLGTLGGPDSVAAIVNESGQVAGTSFTDSAPNSTTGIPTVHPFLWEQGAMRDLGTLGGTNSLSNYLNSRGEVVGWTTLAGDASRHAFLWHKGFLEDLGTAGGVNSEAWAVNDAGEVVGRADFSASSTDHHAFLWKRGVMTDLSTPEGQPCSTAYSINSRGGIVGDSGVCGVGGVGWLWENGGPIVALQTLISPPSDITVTGATFINDRGEIVAGGILPNGDEHAILLVPCDEDHREVEGCDYGVSDVDAIATPQALAPRDVDRGTRRFTSRRGISSYGFGMVEP